MLREVLKRHIKSQASFVEVGYGQVEPNHLSAQRNAQIYAQLPADPAIQVLEQGQFVKYDYAAGLVNFTGAGEWMLVYNEIKLYREDQLDCEFAMIKDNYQARVYSPLDPDKAQELYGPTRMLQGRREWYNNETKDFDAMKEFKFDANGDFVGTEGEGTVPDYAVASKVYDYYEMDDVNNPEIEENYRQRLFMKLRDYEEKMMPAGTAMVPRVFKTMPGDLFTTNTINEAPGSLKVGDLLTPQAADGILAKAGADSADMVWQVVKVYNMPDYQPGVKVMRIK
ncbi:MAG: hypothetical protein ACI4XN_03345 [Candidatus Kurthia intestinigallinarum]